MFPRISRGGGGDDGGGDGDVGGGGGDDGGDDGTVTPVTPVTPDTAGVPTAVTPPVAPVPTRVVTARERASTADALAATGEDGSSEWMLLPAGVLVAFGAIAFSVRRTRRRTL